MNSKRLRGENTPKMKSPKRETQKRKSNLIKRPLAEHLEEFRFRMLFSLFFFMIVSLVLFFVSPYVLKRVINDFINNSVKIVSLSPTEVILSEIRIALFLSFIASLPVFIYHLFKFVKPAVKDNEKPMFVLFILSSPLLFLLGSWFAYFVVLKFAIAFFSKISLVVVNYNLWSIKELTKFILNFCFSFGLVFELPLIMFFLNALGLLSKDDFKKYRPFIYVIIFVLAAVITPPDVITQLILAFPLIILYELSLLFIR